MTKTLYRVQASHCEESFHVSSLEVSSWLESGCAFLEETQQVWSHGLASELYLKAFSLSLSHDGDVNLIRWSPDQDTLCYEEVTIFALDNEQITGGRYYEMR